MGARRHCQHTKNIAWCVFLTDTTASGGSLECAGKDSAAGMFRVWCACLGTLGLLCLKCKMNLYEFPRAVLTSSADEAVRQRDCRFELAVADLNGPMFQLQHRLS